jgi:hypothetical protein
MAGPRTGDSRLDMRRGEVMDPEPSDEEVEVEAGFVEAELEPQPMPDSRKMEDLIGSGELERRRSRKGDLRVAMM